MNRIAHLFHSEEPKNQGPATLPAKFLDNKTVEKMPLGVKLFVVPWAMEVDELQRAYLNPRHGYTNRSMGTSSLPVVRTEQGFIVFVSEMRSDYAWEPGSCTYDYIPVVEIR